MKTMKKAIIIEGFGGLVFFFMFLGLFYDVPVLYILLGMPLSWLAFIFVGEKFGLYKKESNKVPVSDRTENFLFISAMITAALGAVLVTHFFPPNKKKELEAINMPSIPPVLEQERPQAPEVVQGEPTVRPPFREIVPEAVPPLAQEVPCCGSDLPEEESRQVAEEGVPRREDGWHPLMEEVLPEDIVEYAESVFQDSENDPAEESEGDWVEESGLDWNKARLELLEQFEGWQKASLAAAMLEAEQFMEIMSEEDARWIKEKAQRQFDAAQHQNPSSEHAALFYKSLEMTAAVNRSQASAVAKEIRAEIARRTRELYQELGDPGPPPRLQFEEEGR